MSHVLHRSLVSVPPVAVSGAGPYLFDAQGRRYLDASGGAAVSNLGHAYPAVVQAIQRQAAELPYAHSSMFTTEVLEQLADVLVGQAPEMDKVLFVSGGSEAMEAALKLARQYFVEIGQPSRHLFVARKQSYHGNTLGVLGVGGNQWRRATFEPLLQPGHHISPCFEYRWREATEGIEDFGLRVANELESKIEELGAENVAAFVAETVVGATLGAVPAVSGYFRRIRDICDRHGILLILDEVMCGTGRTGSFFAYEQEGVVPDIVAIAKGLAAGYQPIGAMLSRTSITDAIAQGSGFFQHGHTFMGHAVAAAAALATVETIGAETMLDEVRMRGASLRQKLESAVGRHPYVGDIRGRGLFLGIEFVRDRSTKEPFPPEDRFHKALAEAAKQRGLLCYAMGGTIDGILGDHVLIAPPFTITAEQENEIVESLANALATF